jgi:hypothetical protein
MAGPAHRKINFSPSLGHRSIGADKRKENGTILSATLRRPEPEIEIWQRLTFLARLISTIPRHEESVAVVIAVLLVWLCS